MTYDKLCRSPFSYSLLPLSLLALSLGCGDGESVTGFREATNDVTSTREEVPNSSKPTSPGTGPDAGQGNVRVPTVLQQDAGAQPVENAEQGGGVDGGVNAP